MDENTVYTEDTMVVADSTPETEIIWNDLDDVEPASNGKDTFIGVLIGAAATAAIVGVKKLVDKKKAAKQIEEEPKKKFRLPFGKKKAELKVIEGDFEEVKEEAAQVAEEVKEVKAPAKKTTTVKEKKA